MYLYLFRTPIGPKTCSNWMCYGSDQLQKHENIAFLAYVLQSNRREPRT